MRMRSWATAFLLAMSVPAPAADGGLYANARFGYRIAVPEGFATGAEADNGDGIAAKARKGTAALRVWGGAMQAGSFRDEVRGAIASDAAEGWTITYRSVKAEGASWSGTRGGRILYVRAIPLCDAAVGTLQLDYAATEAARYDALVGRLVKSFRRERCS